MGLDYVDMLILHQPCGDYIAAWHAMEDAYEAGKVHALGLSNFPEEKIAEVIAAARKTRCPRWDAGSFLHVSAPP